MANAAVMTITGCAFRGNGQTGVAAFDIVEPMGMTVMRCSFEYDVPNLDNFGVLAARSRGIRTIDCRFLGHGRSVAYATVLDGLVDRCFFHRGWAGVQMDQGSTGEIRECDFVGIQRTPISVSLEATVRLTNNRVGGGSWNSLWVQNLSHIEGTGNRLGGGVLTTIYFGGNPTAALSNSAIHRGGQMTIRLGSYLEGMPNQLDLTGNWWGTTDPDSIDAWIWDGNDDPAIKAVVEYEPFLKNPLPARQTSFSEFKSLFSGGN